MQEVIPHAPTLEQAMQLLSRTLFELHEAAEHLAINEYPHAAMQALKCLIGFDGGMLGVVDHALALRQAHVYGRSAALASELAPMLPVDPMARCLLQGAATPVACDCEHFYGERALFRQDHFYRKHHIARMLLCGGAEGDGCMGRMIALFRSAGEPFNVGDRQYLMAVWPHIVRGMECNRRRCLDHRVAEHSGRAAALMNRQGMLEAEDPAFLSALLEEWPQFSGRSMPDAVVECWHDGMAFIGTRIRISMSSMSVQDGCILCLASSCGVPHVLTRAERVVACQFASGLSHKQIAEKLGVSQNTVRSHIAHAYEKLDIHDKAALANMLTAEPALR